MEARDVLRHIDGSAQELDGDALHLSGMFEINGRIVKRDIEQAMQTKPAESAPNAAATIAAPSLADETIRVSQKRKIIAQRLAESMFTAPHFYLKVTVNMDGILAARTALNATRKEKVSLNAFLVKFVAEALKKHAIVNSTWHGDTIVKHGSVDVGLAVAQPDGRQDA